MGTGSSLCEVHQNNLSSASVISITQEPETSKCLIRAFAEAFVHGIHGVDGVSFRLLRRASQPCCPRRPCTPFVPHCKNASTFGEQRPHVMAPRRHHARRQKARFGKRLRKDHSQR